jgi:hypothetical protein
MLYIRVLFNDRLLFSIVFLPAFKLSNVINVCIDNDDDDWIAFKTSLSIICLELFAL